jgi:DNA mismatch repair protein MutS2
MDSKTLNVIEYHKVLERLAAHCDFSASQALARQLEPTTSFELAHARQQETTEARTLLSLHDLTIGGAHDIRPKVDLARHGGVLDAPDLLDVKSTLISCRELKKTLEKMEPQYPRIGGLALSLPNPTGIVDSISHTISDKGEVLDSASVKLAGLRREMRVAHERLMSRLQKYITDGKTVPMLQDTLITQRDGRYVIPLRAEFKGQIKSIVHDQSASGATLFVEPIAVVEMNNTYRELQLAERDEVRKVLAELSAQVGMAAAEIISGVEALAELDLAFAKAKYAEEIHASEPLLHPLDGDKKKPIKGKQATGGEEPAQDAQNPQTPNPGAVIRLFQARHPLLDPHNVVPLDIDLAPGTFALVITGPNTGGKTVTLKTVGLMAAMAQSGLHIPVQSGSELSLFHDLHADIGDEQSIEQSLSTFSGHITNIIRILKVADNRQLVILDELGAGTDPQEGAALARAILSHLLARGVTTFVATHYPELKTFAHGTPGVVNASLEFDVKTLRPTYKLTIGLPGRSNALAIATRLGLPQEIIAAAKSEINPLDLRADKMLDDIRRQRNQTSHEREKAEKAKQRADATRLELEKRLEHIEDERRQVLEKARAEGEMEVAILQQQIDTLKEQMKKARQPLDAIKAVEDQMEVLEEKVQQPTARKVVPKQAPPGTLKLGERVFLRTIKAEGVITSLSESDAEVQVGALRVRAKLSDLARPSEEPEAGPPKETGRKRRIKQAVANIEAGPSTHISITSASPGMELDLRGQNSEDALAMLDDYLDRAYLSGMPFVRIIHGKGTGKLRESVRGMLKDHPHVASFEEGHQSEGGAGVTVAKIVKD